MKYELDGAFVSSLGEHVEFETVEVGTEELVLISGRQTTPIHHPEQLRHLTIFVFRVGCHYRRILEDWLHLKGIPAKIMDLGTLEGILGCIHAGLGVSLLPLSDIERALIKYDLQYHKISEELVKIPTIFIRSKDTYNTAAISEFIRVSRERFNDI